MKVRRQTKTPAVEFRGLPAGAVFTLVMDGFGVYYLKLSGPVHRGADLHNCVRLDDGLPCHVTASCAVTYYPQCEAVPGPPGTPEV